jgi:hypothetical protein
MHAIAVNQSLLAVHRACYLTLGHLMVIPRMLVAEIALMDTFKEITPILLAPSVHKLNAKNVKTQKSASNVLMGIFCPKNLILPMEPSSDLMHSA